MFSTAQPYPVHPVGFAGLAQPIESTVFKAVIGFRSLEFSQLVGHHHEAFFTTARVSRNRQMVSIHGHNSRPLENTEQGDFPE